MARETRKIEGYILVSSSYRDSDQMVTLLTKDGPISFLARGASKITSQNRGLIQPLAHGEYLLEEGKAGGLSLKEGKVDSFVDGKDDFSRLSFISYLTEVSNKVSSYGEGEEAYHWLEVSLRHFEDMDILSNCAMHLSHLLGSIGYAPKVDGCLVCAKKTDIVGFSFLDGGFFCSDHLDSEAHRLSPYKLKMIRYLFLSGESNYGRVSFPMEEASWAIKELGEYSEQIAGLKINSLRYLLK